MAKKIKLWKFVFAALFWDTGMIKGSEHKRLRIYLTGLLSETRASLGSFRALPLSHLNKTNYRECVISKRSVNVALPMLWIYLRSTGFLGILYQQKQFLIILKNRYVQNGSLSDPENYTGILNSRLIKLLTWGIKMTEDRIKSAEVGVERSDSRTEGHGRCPCRLIKVLQVEFAHLISKLHWTCDSFLPSKFPPLNWKIYNCYLMFVTPLYVGSVGGK